MAIRREKGKTMKKVILTLPVLFFIFSAAAVYAEEQTGPRLTFDKDEYDCGTIYFEDIDIKTIEIGFTNTGEAPLVLDNVRSCCGTVVTGWPREPVLPGDNAKIEVRFRVASRPHMIRRAVSVASNDTSAPRQRIHITGRVTGKAE